MSKKISPALNPSTLFIFAWAFICILCSSIPYYTNPALLVGSWVAAFGESFFNTFPPSLYSHNFGFPTPIPMVFGITGALPAGVLIHMGIHPTDAYTIVFSLYLGVSLWGAWRLAMLIGVNRYLALLGAIFWCSFPVIRGASRLCMLGIGFALLPMYFWIVLVAYRKVCAAQSGKDIIIFGCLYTFMMIFALFTEGYSFVMLICASFFFLVYIFVCKKFPRKRIALLLLPLTLFGALCAYFLYRAYIGSIPLNSSPITVFRAHGTDLLSLFYTVHGQLWFPDILGTNIPTYKIYFGEHTEWWSNYSIPLILFSSVCLFLKNNKTSFYVFFIFLAAVGLYLSLGPSFKYDSHVDKESDIMDRRSMDERFAHFPTGSRSLWEKIPGFKNMRVTSRWCLLFFFALWMADMVCLSTLRGEKKNTICAYAMLILSILAYLPHIDSEMFRTGKYNRDHHFRIDNDFVAPLGMDIQPDSKVAILPYGNDFVASYLAARRNIRTYNTGQDKGLGLAMKGWPKDFPMFTYADLSDKDKIQGIGQSITSFLLADPKRIVVFPLIDFGWESYSSYWTEAYRDEIIQNRTSAFLPLIEGLKKIPALSIKQKATYFIVCPVR